jgi:glucose/arabinose dehydrogenase
VPSDFAGGVFATPRRLRLPVGYHIGVFAAGLSQPRGLAVSPAGELFATLIGSGQVVVLRDPNHSGHATDIETFASDLQNPHGIAFANGWIYVGDTDSVLRLQDSTGGYHADRREVVVPNLPPGGQHFTRTVHVGPDGKLYVSIGSSCNACVEADPRRAAIVRYNLDGSGEHIFGQGMRNAVGFTFQPGTGLLWAVVNGRDYLGDDLPGEDITSVRDGDDLGWPRCYGDRVPDPELGAPGACAAKTEPTMQIQAHSAPLGATFDTGQQLAPRDRNSLFVALHGSWNRSVPTGYKVIEVLMRDGQPNGVQDFATGWLVSGTPWGRPVDVAAASDGSLFVSDDAAGAVYRIWYDGKP